MAGRKSLPLEEVLSEAKRKGGRAEVGNSSVPPSAAYGGHHRRKFGFAKS